MLERIYEFTFLCNFQMYAGMIKCDVNRVPDLPISAACNALFMRIQVDIVDLHIWISTFTAINSLVYDSKVKELFPFFMPIIVTRMQDVQTAESLSSWTNVVGAYYGYVRFHTANYDN